MVDDAYALEKDRQALIWALGPDVGASSLALLALLMAIPDAAQPQRLPADCWDFGRCARMVERLGFRERLLELADDPLWSPLIWEWEKLEALAEKAKLTTELYPTDHDFREVAAARDALSSRLNELGRKNDTRN